MSALQIKIFAALMPGVITLQKLITVQNINFCLLSLLDINECTTNQDICHSNAWCNNTIGGYNCTCRDGYEGNGTVCNGMVRICCICNIHIVICIFLSWLYFSKGRCLGLRSIFLSFLCILS